MRGSWRGRWRGRGREHGRCGCSYDGGGSNGDGGSSDERQGGCSYDGAGVGAGAGAEMQDQRQSRHVVGVLQPLELRVGGHTPCAPNRCLSAPSRTVHHFPAPNVAMNM